MKDRYSTTEIKNFWDMQAGKKDISNRKLTHRDIWQRWLEIETIKKFIRPEDRVLDVGCGNGYSTKRIAPWVNEIMGVDYSEEMIKRAIRDPYPKDVPRAKLPVFKKGDVLDLDSSKFGLFDVVISERCLINLASWEDQKQAIANIASVLKAKGLFIFVEGSKDGRRNLNKMREKTGLTSMPRVWHNLDFEEKKVLDYVRRFFTVQHKLNFGVYDFVSRIVHPLLAFPKEPVYDSRINKVAAKLALHTQEFGHISRVLFLVLKKSR